MTRRTLVAVVLALVVNLPTQTVAAQSPYPSVFITGQIRNAGQYKFQDGMTAGQLIAMAGGLTERGDASSVVISRKVGNELTKVNGTSDTPLLANDVVAVGMRVRQPRQDK